ncbi:MULTISPECIES: hypothetical protein [Sulfurimonas]|uniref:hypothetical protein n=1 Tax=Sulfurimonas TaxID=202746 RepID=UPI00126432FC|nr:hypothetical protein [Sulfurimonas indica]
MDISSSGNNIIIHGNIKSVRDYQILKDMLDEVKKTHESIILTIKNSISITSSIIGYLTKLVQKEGVDLSIKVGDSSLFELFDDLNLVTLFKVKKV